MFFPSDILARYAIIRSSSSRSTYTGPAALYISHVGLWMRKVQMHDSPVSDC